MTGTSPLKDQVGVWAESVFTTATNASIVNHLGREVKELEELAYVPDKYCDSPTLKAELGEEIADCALLLMHLAWRNGIDIDQEASKKYWKNRGRVWGPPDEYGVREHIEKDLTTA